MDGPPGTEGFGKSKGIAPSGSLTGSGVAMSSLRWKSTVPRGRNTFSCVCACVCVCMCMHVFACVCMCVCTCVSACAHTCARTCAHTCVRAGRGSGKTWKREQASGLSPLISLTSISETTTDSERRREDTASRTCPPRPRPRGPTPRGPAQHQPTASHVSTPVWLVANLLKPGSTSQPFQELRDLGIFEDYRIPVSLKKVPRFWFVQCFP